MKITHEEHERRLVRDAAEVGFMQGIMTGKKLAAIEDSYNWLDEFTVAIGQSGLALQHETWNRHDLSERAKDCEDLKGIMATFYQYLCMDSLIDEVLTDFKLHKEM